MTPDRAALIITMCEEPDMLLAPGESVPQFDPAEIHEAYAIQFATFSDDLTTHKESSICLAN